ncbi:MAG: MurR/RpiR family transcriptional regulator [Clostridia bacterium]|nr:MurR/RpiR family transcriptional regulator [Clostridia bacterium]
MGKTILNIKVNYDSLSKTEKRIADFLIENPDNILPLYITELAESCGASEATIVRFAKKFGFEGYQQLKLAIAREEHTAPVNENITPSDTPYDIFTKVCDDIYCSLEKTKKALDQEALQRCCDAILSSDDIIVLGLGNSAPIASDASHKMLRLGLRAHPYTDNHMQAIATAHANERTVVIGISHSGASEDILDAMRIAKSGGAFTVAITNYQKSPIEAVSDAVLYTVSDETNYRILGLSSRISQLSIIDTIYSYLVCHIDNARDSIAKTEAALQTKKHNENKKQIKRRDQL